MVLKFYKIIDLTYSESFSKKKKKIPRTIELLKQKIGECILR